VKKLSFALLGSMGLATAGCGDPAVQTSADRAGVGLTTTVSGQVILQGAARGDVDVFLYDAARPPPPAGTGRPVSFVQLPAATVFGQAVHDAHAAGPFAAHFAFSLVSPGTYLVAATLDRDDCLVSPSTTCQLADFNPFFDVLDQPNGGDELGGHVDAAGALTPVVVPTADATGHLGPVSDIAVQVGQAVPDRPSFQVVAPPASLSASLPSLLKLDARPLAQGPVEQPRPAFLFRYRDENHDGVRDVDATGIPQLWPKVFIRKLADPTSATPANLLPTLAVGLRDENDLDNDGQLDAAGKSYARKDGTDDGKPALVVLAALWVDDLYDPTQPPSLTNPPVPRRTLGALADPDGGPDLSLVVPQTSMELLVLPQAYDARDPAHPAPLAAVPAGRYAVIVEQFTGQTWRLPNELQPAVAPKLGTDGLADQGLILTVP
jgi:hypothetical protein